MIPLPEGVIPNPAPLSSDPATTFCRETSRVVVHLYNRWLSKALGQYLGQQGFTVRVYPDVETEFVPTIRLTDLPSLQPDAGPNSSREKIIVLDEGLTVSEVETVLGHPRVVGVIRNDCDDQLLAKALRCVEGGELWIDNKTLRTLLNLHHAQRQTNLDIHLTIKETRIVTLLLQGMKNKEIADQVCLSESTVKVYVSRLYRKYEVANRAQLVKKLTSSARPV